MCRGQSQYLYHHGFENDFNVLEYNRIIPADSRAILQFRRLVQSVSHCLTPVMQENFLISCSEVHYDHGMDDKTTGF